MVALSRATSCWARPRLFTSSMLRSDSVVAPARAVVSATMTFWIVLILRERTELSEPEQGHGQEVDGSDDPVDAEGVDDHEDDAHQRREEDVDGGGDQLLDVGADLLQLAQGLAAPLVLEDLVGQVQRVADAVRVDLGPQALGDHVDEVVLEVLGHPGDEGHAHRRRQEQAHPAEELRRSCTPGSGSRRCRSRGGRSGGRGARRPG